MNFREMFHRLFPLLSGEDDCRAVRSRLVDRLTAGPADARGAADADHLARCEACRGAYHHLLEAWNGLPEAADVTPPADVSERVLATAREALAAIPPGERGGRPRAEQRRGRPRRDPAWRPPRWLLLPAGLAGAVAVLLVTLVVRESGDPPVAVGREVPDVRMMQVATGDDRSLSGYRGEVVLLHVWATWCIPCEREMPTLERLERRLGPEGLRVVAVSIDRESRHKVQRWAEERGLDLTLLQDRTGRIETRYQVAGVPETFLIGPDGVLLWRGAGARDWDDPDQAEVVHAFLRRGGAS